jgi:hypothetical protein
LKYFIEIIKNVSISKQKSVYIKNNSSYVIGENIFKTITHFAFFSKTIKENEIYNRLRD